MRKRRKGGREGGKEGGYVRVIVHLLMIEAMELLP